MAKAGAVDLARFYDGITAARDGAPGAPDRDRGSHGSLTTGLALQVPGSHGVSDAIFYGSPGNRGVHPAQLNLPAGHVSRWRPRRPHRLRVTPHRRCHTAATVTPCRSTTCWWPPPDASGTGHFGPNPATNPNSHPPGDRADDDSLDGHGEALHLEGASGTKTTRARAHCDARRHPTAADRRATTSPPVAGPTRDHGRLGCALTG